MCMTPEGKIKKEVKKILSHFGDQVYVFMPVQTGYGPKTLDFLGCFNGKFFSIETKAPGKKPTPLQEITINSILNAGGTIFVIDGPMGFGELKLWLTLNQRT